MQYLLNRVIKITGKGRTPTKCHSPHSRNTEGPIMQQVFEREILYVTHKTVQARVNIPISNPKHKEQ